MARDGPENYLAIAAVALVCGGALVWLPAVIDAAPNYELLAGIVGGVALGVSGTLVKVQEVNLRE